MLSFAVCLVHIFDIEIDALPRVTALREFCELLERIQCLKEIEMLLMLHRLGPRLNCVSRGHLLPGCLFDSFNDTLGVNVYKHVPSDAALADNTDTVVRVFSVGRACILLEFFNGCCLMVSPVAEHSHLRQRMDGRQSESFLNQGCSNFNEFHCPSIS